MYYICTSYCTAITTTTIPVSMLYKHRRTVHPSRQYNRNLPRAIIFFLRVLTQTQLDSFDSLDRTIENYRAQSSFFFARTHLHTTHFFSIPLTHHRLHATIILNFLRNSRCNTVLVLQLQRVHATYNYSENHELYSTSKLHATTGKP